LVLEYAAVLTVLGALAAVETVHWYNESVEKGAVVLVVVHTKNKLFPSADQVT
jgi:hypothetical protein